MTPLVVDASVALKWFVPEPDSDKADELIRTEAELIAPDLIWLELANAVWKHARIGNVDASIWEDVAAKLPGLLTIQAAEGPLLDLAFKLASGHEHPIYDCLYLALAIQMNAIVITVDKRFLDAFARTDHAARVISLEVAVVQF